MAPHRLVQAATHSSTLQRWSVRRRVAIVVWAGPVLFLFATLAFVGESGLYVMRSVVVEGTVVQRYEWPGETIFDRGVTNYEPIFAYEIEGETYQASVGSSHSSFDVEVGETAMIRAIPGDRGNVRMDTWQGLWFIPRALAFFTAIAFAVAGLIWVLLWLIFFRRKVEVK